MGIIAFSLIISIAVLICLILLSTWILRYMIHRLVFVKHNEIETIISEGKVPDEWSKYYSSKLKKKKNDNDIKKLQRNSKQNILLKLSKLEKYVQTSNLVEDEKTRSQLVKEFKDVREYWKENPLDLII